MFLVICNIKFGHGACFRVSYIIVIIKVGTYILPILIIYAHIWHFLSSITMDWAIYHIIFNAYVKADENALYHDITINFKRPGASLNLRYLPDII